MNDPVRVSVSERLFLVTISSIYLTTSMPLLHASCVLADLSGNFEPGYPFISHAQCMIVSDAIGNRFDICNMR